MYCVGIKPASRSDSVALLARDNRENVGAWEWCDGPQQEKPGDRVENETVSLGGLGVEDRGGG